MSKVIKLIDQRGVHSSKIHNVSKEKNLENWQKMQQKPVINEQTNSYHQQMNHLQQFLSANPRMRALYESQMRLVYLNNFWNQRRQQMLYAAYMFAQNKLKYNSHLQHHIANRLVQQKRWNAMNNNQRTFLNQPNKSYNYNNFCNIQSNNKTFNERSSEKNKKAYKHKNCNKVKNTFNFSKTNKLPVENNTDLQISSSTNKNIIKNHMQALINGFAIKNKHPSTTASTSKQAKAQNSINSSNVISIRIPNVTERYKPNNHFNSSSSTSNQIIVTEKQAKLIVNQVKEEMRGRDPENMYIKCPLCEKRIKRFDMLISLKTRQSL